MKTITNLERNWLAFQYIRGDLAEGEISLDEAIVRMETLGKQLTKIVEKWANRNVSIALRWQQLEINVVLYSEMLRMKKLQETT